MAGFSPEEGIKQAAPCAGVYAVAQIGGGPGETVFLIRERSGVIAELGRAPAVHVRAGLIVDDGVLLLPVLIQVSGELYEAWMTYHAEVWSVRPPWRAWHCRSSSRCRTSTSGAPVLG